MKTDGVGYSNSNPALSSNIVKQLEDVKKQIAGGQIRIASTLADSMRLTGFPQNLRAVDD